MAILFHEGLPRSGKSYEAMANVVIPWLKKGQEVVAYIEGLDSLECQQRIAEAAELPLEQVQALLYPLTREDMKPRTVTQNGKEVQIDGTWIEKTRDNALHVFDEAQNWWGNRVKASPALTQFVTEHGHRGITVLLMGQSLKDVHALWRRRVDQKFMFLKLTALGSAKRYRVTVYKGQGNDEFVKVSDRISKYDPKYFGTYKSHVDDDIITDTYTDDRVNVLKTGAFKWGIPFALVLAIWGGKIAWDFFHPEYDQVQPAPAVKGPAPGHIQRGPVSPAQQQVSAPVKPKTPQERHFLKLSETARPRLVGLISRSGRVDGVVEWVEPGARVVERMSLDQIRVLGVAVMQMGAAVRLSVGDWDVLVTMWPTEAEGRVSEARQELVRGGRGSGGVISSQPQFVVMREPSRPPERPAAPFEVRSR